MITQSCIEAKRLFDTGKFFLLDNLAIMSYLNHRRIPKSYCAYIPENFDFAGFSNEFIKQVRHTVSDRIIFPIIYYTNIVGFICRSIDKSKVKYLIKPVSSEIKGSSLVYGFDFLKFSPEKDNSIVLVEGPTDAIALNSYGINSVSSLGTSLSFNQASLILFFSKNIIICYDGDLAGILGINKALFTLADFNCIPKICLLPDGHDPDSYIKNINSKLPDTISAKEFINNCFIPDVRNEYISLFSQPFREILL